MKNIKELIFNKRWEKDYGIDALNEFYEQLTEPLADDNEIKRVEIVVLKYKSEDVEKDCLTKLIECTQHPYKLVVYDNRPNSANMSSLAASGGSVR